MKLSDISREMFGFDISEFSLDMAAMQEVNTPEPSSPTKSRLLSSPHKRSRSRTNGVASGSQASILLQQSQTMRDLEVLILALDALERYAIIYEKLEKYVMTIYEWVCVVLTTGAATNGGVIRVCSRT